MTPYFEQGGIRIYHCDFRELGSGDLVDVGAVIADPPYGVTSLAWDRWPFGWPVDLADRVPQVASMWCFGSMRMFLDRADQFGSWKYAQDIVWEKQNGSGFDAERFRRVHEHAVMWYRGPWADVYTKPQQTFGHDPVKVSPSKGDRPVAHAGKISKTTYESNGERLMKSIIRVKTVHHDDDVANETQKPIGIFEPLIRYSLAPDKVLFDPFMGSGTALVVAKSMGARAIGCDLREDQCEAAARRVVQTMALG